MQKFTDAAQSLAVYRELAWKIFPNGSVIRCPTCEIERRCTTEEIAYWTQNGWPVCKKCNRKTTLDNPWKR